MNWRRTLTSTPVLAVFIILAMISGAAAVLFFHTFPGTTSTAAVVTSTCANNALVALPATAPVGSSGTTLYQCPGGAAAISTIPGIATPTFTLPPAGTGNTLTFVLVPHVAGATTCSVTATGAISLSTGTAVTWIATTAGSYNYCLGYTSYPSGGIGSFALNWN